MLRISHFLQQWFNLSDSAMEATLHDNLKFGELWAWKPVRTARPMRAIKAPIGVFAASGLMRTATNFKLN